MNNIANMVRRTHKTQEQILRVLIDWSGVETYQKGKDLFLVFQDGSVLVLQGLIRK